MNKVIGRRIPRIEGKDKASGKAIYSADVVLPGMLWGKVLRSPYPYARILAVHSDQAKRLHGVRSVITGQSIPHRLVGRMLRDLPVLCRNVVRYVGDRVAAVAADTPDIAEEALDLIEVEYEELGPVFDPQIALSPDAPLLHPDRPSYGYIPGDWTGWPRPKLPSGLPNVQSLVDWRRGDVDQGFVESNVIVENVFRTAAVHQAYIEPSACTVEIDDSSKVRVWMTHKNPHFAKMWLAQALDLPDHQIVFEFVRIGGDFGGKGDLRDSPIAYHLAKETGRPVRIVSDYTEEFSSASTRHASVIELKTGVKRDGTLVAHKAKAIFDGGAYAAYKPRPDVTMVGPRSLGGAYRIPNVLMEAYCVYTNHVPGGFMRAPGEPQVIFAVESHMDIVAHTLGLAPYEFRLRNLLTDGEISPTGRVWVGVQSRRVLEAAAKVALWRAPKPRADVGRGIAISNQKIGTGFSKAKLAIASDGHVILWTAVPDAGVGAHTMLRQVVAEVLKVPLELVEVVLGNTDETPLDMGLGASRHTYIHGQAVLKGAAELIQKLKNAAAEILGCDANTIELTDGHFVYGPRRSRVPFRELAKRVSQKTPIEVHSEYIHPGDEAEIECFCAQVAEVEVDRETGQVTVLSLVVANDTGIIINPLMLEGQIEGGAVQGLGFALMEELRLEDGRVMNANFGDYKIPTAHDIPELRKVFIQDAPGPAPFGARPVGEYALAPTAPAIANAIFDAVGIRITETPLTSEKVYWALQRLSKPQG